MSRRGWACLVVEGPPQLAPTPRSSGRGPTLPANDLTLGLFASAIKAVSDASRCPRHDRLVRGRLERIPRDGLSPWLIAAALGLASAAAAGLKAPNWVWIVALVAAGLFAIVGIVLLFVHVPAAPASLSRNPSDLALRIASELHEEHVLDARMKVDERAEVARREAERERERRRVADDAPRAQPTAVDETAVRALFGRLAERP